uniref:Putative regulatory protein n=1 Tax=viral metagenome TaxID=1070528 RepID=A0A6M3JF17_9ZZZZ
MPVFDILEYRKAGEVYYGKDAPLLDVAKDVYENDFKADAPDFETWAKKVGIESHIQDDIKRRTPTTFWEKLVGGTAHVAPKLGEPEKGSTVRGVVSSFGEGLARGLTTEIPKMVGGATEFVGSYLPEATGIQGAGKSLKEWSTEKEKEWYGDEQERQGLERIVYEGTKMLGPSVIPGRLVGTGIRTLRGVGSLVKAARVAGAAGETAKAAELMASATQIAKQASNVASGTVAGLFGLSQAQQSVDTANERADALDAQGKTEEANAMRAKGQGWAPLATGAIEAAGEFLGTKYLGKLFHLDEAEIVKRGAKNVVIRFLKTLGVEISTETSQAGGEAAVEKYVGIRPEADPIAEALDVIGPTAFMTLLTGGVAGVANRRGKKEPLAIAAENIKKMQATTAFSDAIDTGLRTGQVDGKEFTPDHALELVRRGLQENIYTTEDVDKFKAVYPGLREGLNEIITEQALLKVDQAVKGGAVITPEEASEVTDQLPGEAVGETLPEAKVETAGEGIAPPGADLEADYKKQADELGIRYDGIQEGIGSVPSYPLFTDNVTGSSFGLQEGGNLPEELAKVRAKFEGKPEETGAKFDESGYATEGEALAAITNRKLSVADHTVEQVGDRWMVSGKSEAGTPIRDMPEEGRDLFNPKSWEGIDIKSVEEPKLIFEADAGDSQPFIVRVNGATASFDTETTAENKANAQAFYDTMKTRVGTGKPTPVAERRQDLETRKRIAEMSPEEMSAELLTNHLTKLDNKRAYEEKERKPVQASIDVDSLKWVNDTYGHGAGNDLLKAMGAALKQSGLPDVYHFSGDEFHAEGNTPEEIKTAIQVAREYLKKNPLTFTDKAGVARTVSAGFSYGVGESIDIAEVKLQEDKIARQKSGERAGRGEAPVEVAGKIKSAGTGGARVAKTEVAGVQEPTATGETGKQTDLATNFPDLPKNLARFDKGPGGYREDVTFVREQDQGWERYYNQTPEQRTEAFKDIVNSMSRGTAEERAFSRGWMDARDKAKSPPSPDVSQGEAATPPQTAEQGKPIIPPRLKQLADEVKEDTALGIPIGLPSTPNSILIRPFQKSDMGKGTGPILAALPEKEGYEKVYKPYGEQGKGFYYVKVGGTPVPPQEKAPEGAKADTLESFAATLPPLRKGRSLAALRKKRNHDKYGLVTSAEMIEKMAAEGRKATTVEATDEKALSDAKEERRRIYGSGNQNIQAKRVSELDAIINNPPKAISYRYVSPDGSFYDMTRTEYYYAKHIEALAENPPLPAPETATITEREARRKPEPEKGELPPANRLPHPGPSTLLEPPIDRSARETYKKKLEGIRGEIDKLDEERKRVTKIHAKRRRGSTNWGASQARLNALNIQLDALGKEASVLRNTLFKEELKDAIQKPRDEAQKVAAELKLGELTEKGKPFIDAKYKELTDTVKKMALAKNMTDDQIKDFAASHALELSQYPLTETYDTNRRIDQFIESRKKVAEATEERRKADIETAKKKVAEAERVQKEDYARKARQEAAKKTLGPVAKAVPSDEIFEGEEGFVKAIEKAIGRKLNADVDEAAVTMLAIRGTMVTTGELGADLRDALRNSTAVPMKTRKDISNDMVQEFGITRTEPANVTPVKPVKDRKQTYANMMTFASDDVQRRQLNGFYSDEGNLIATNGHMMFVHYGVAGNLKDKSINEVTKSGVLAEIEGQFPDYKRIFPERNEANERVLAADQAAKIVSMLKVTAKRNLLSTSASGYLGAFPVDINGVNVSGTYLSDILTGVLKTGADKIVFTTPEKDNKPFVVDGYQAGKQTAKGIVMPVKESKVSGLKLTAEDLGGKPEAPQGEISKKDMTETEGMFEAPEAKAEPAAKEPAIDNTFKPDNEIYDIDSANARMKSIQAQLDKEINSGARSNNAVDFDNKNKRIAKLNERRDAFSRRIRAIKNGEIVAPPVKEKAIKPSNEERRAALLLKDKEAYDASPAKDYVETLLGDSVNQYNKTALAKFLDGTEKKYGGLIDGKWIPALDKIGLPESLRTQDTLNQDIAAFIKQKYQPAKEPAPGTEDAGIIADFGEKIGGAKKDKIRSESFSHDLTDDDLLTLPLSKIWPKSEVDAIEDPFVAAFATAARGAIPTKPQMKYKKARWVEKVKAFRGMMTDLFNDIEAGTYNRDRVLEKATDFSPLKDFFAKVRLLEAIDRTQWDRIGDVAEHPDAYRYGEKMADEKYEKFLSPSVAVHIDGRYKSFEVKSVEEALPAIKEALENINPDAAAAAKSFEVRGRGESYFINKKGDGKYHRLKEFTTSKEALTYVKEHPEELWKAWDVVKELENVSGQDVRSSENRPRTGSDHRKGKDVTTEQFSEAFGFRGVEFGNWVGQGKNAKERQGMMNEAYDALMDLADIVGIPAKAISLNGSLGLAFGARGSGWASAHYEPDKIVINLTKTRGSGSLAHEWLHALDNYFSRTREGEVKLYGGLNAGESYRAKNYITYRPEPLYVHNKMSGSPITKARLDDFHARHPKSEYYDPANWHIDANHPQGVRPEVEAAFSRLVKVLDESPMTERSATIKADYWSRIIERAARAFENYVIVKMAAKGYQNDYLANVVRVEDFKRDAGRYPYLLDEEIAPVAEAFDSLFDTVQTRETPKGVQMYGAVHPEDEWNSSVMDDTIRQTWKQRLEEYNEQQGAIRENWIGGTADGTRGEQDNEVSYRRGLQLRRLFDENLRGLGEGFERGLWEGVIFSPAFGETTEFKLARDHFASFGYTAVPMSRVSWGGSVNPETKTAFIGEMSGDRFAYFMSHEASHILGDEGNEAISKIIANIDPWHPDFIALKERIPFTQEAVRDEVAATLAGGWDKFRSVLKGPKEYDDANIKEARAAALKSETKAGRRYSLSAHPPAFYSQLASVVDKKMQGRMPVDQLRKMLKGNGVTDAEVENITGALTGTVTKQQVMDEIKANSVELKDVVLGGIGGGERVLRNDDMVRLRQIVKANDQLGFDSLGEAANAVIQDGADIFDWNTSAERDEVRRILDRKESPTHFSQYTEPGAVPGSYREMFVTVPASKEAYKIVPAKDGNGYNIQESDGSLVLAPRDYVHPGVPLVWDSMEFAQEGLRNYDKNAWQDGHSQYSSIANPIVRIRYNEREADGERILFVEEIQGPSDANQQKMPEYLRKRIYDIGVKRVLALAKEQGFDGASWTTGEMQADRYNLAKYLDNITYEPISRVDAGVSSDITGKFYVVDGPLFENYSEAVQWAVAEDKNNPIFEVSATDKSGKTVFTEDEIGLKRIEELAGKEIAEKIKKGEGTKLNDSPYRNWKELSGLDLKVGGEGLKRLYDVTIPALFKKYGKEGVGSIPLNKTANGLSARVYVGPAYTEAELREKAVGNVGSALSMQLINMADAMRNGATFQEAANQHSSIAAAALLDGESVVDENALKQSVPFIPITDKTPASYPLYSTIDTTGKPATIAAKGEQNGTGLTAPDQSGIAKQRASVLPEVREEHARRVGNERKGISGDVKAPYRLRKANTLPGQGIIHDPEGYDRPDFKELQDIAASHGLDLIPIKDTTKSVNAFINEGAIFLSMEPGDVPLPNRMAHEISHFLYGKSPNKGKVDTDSKAFRQYRENLSKAIYGEDAYSRGYRADIPLALEEFVADLESGMESIGGVKLSEGLKEGQSVAPITEGIGEGRRYSARQSSPPVTKDTRKLNDWLKDDTDAIIKTIMDKLQRDSGMTWTKSMFLSPEWWDHPQLAKIVKLFTRDRNELYHETFNDLNAAEMPFETYDTIAEAAKSLKNRGLTMAQRWAGEVSPEYQHLQDIIEEGDTTWQRDKKKPLSEQMKAFEAHIKDQGATADTIAVWKLYRQSYDKALDLQTKQMRDMMEQISEEAAFKGISPADYSDLWTTLKGALAMMETWKGFYAPRIREQGDWKVQASRGVGEAKSFRREHARSELAANRIATRLAREGWKVYSVGKVEKLPEDIYQDVSAISTAKLIDSAMDKLKSGGDSTLKFSEEVLRVVADEIRARGFRSHMMHRGASVVSGYIEDPMKRHLLYSNQISGGISKAKVARQAMMELLGTKVEGKQVGGIDATKEAEAYKVGTAYIREQLRNVDSSDRIIGLAKSVATFKFLGFNLRSLAVNVTAMATTAPSAIHQYAMGGKGSMFAIMREIGIAGKDYGKFMAGRELANPGEQRFMDEVKRKGWDDAQYTREALGELSKVHSKVWSTIMDGSMYLFGKSEQWNRGATMLAAYRVAKKRGMNDIDAAEAAKTASDKAHGVYGKSTLPMWAQGTNPAAKIGQMAYVYQKFGHNYLQMLHDLGAKKHNMKALAFAILSPMVLAGGAALPFKDAIFALFAAILGGDPEKWVWDQIREHLGTEAERVGRHGLTGAAGLDISGSLSIGVGVPKNLMDLTGAIGGVLQEAGEAAGAISEGRYAKAAEHLLPSGFANPLRAMRESKEGVVTRNQRRVWDEKGRPFVPSTGETAARALGFRSANQATLSERTWEAKRQQTRLNDKKSAIYEAFRSWSLGGQDRNEYNKIIEMAKKFNSELQAQRINTVAPITSQSLRDQARRMQAPTKRVRALLAP